MSYNGRFAAAPRRPSMRTVQTFMLPPVVNEGVVMVRAVDELGEPARLYRLTAERDVTAWGATQRYPVVVSDPLLPTSYYELWEMDVSHRASMWPTFLRELSGPVFTFTIGKNKARNYYRSRYLIGAAAIRVQQAFFEATKAREGER